MLNKTFILLSLIIGLNASSLNFDVQDFLNFVHTSVSNGDITSGLQSLSQEHLDLFDQIRSRKLDQGEGDGAKNISVVSEQCLSHMGDYAARWALPLDGLMPHSGGNWPRKSKFK